MSKSTNNLSFGAQSAFRARADGDAPTSSDPTFRSVRMDSMSKPAFGAMGPLPKLGKAPMISSSFRSKPDLKAVPSLSANAEEPAPKFVWVVTLVPSVPEFYPLDRTVLKLDGASINEICSRISDFMRQKSIKCAEDPSSEACIGCLTPGLLKFAIQLWKGDGQDGSEEGRTQTILVEVQRRKGCAIEMKGIRNCLYHAIQNGGDGSAAKRPSCVPRSVPSSFMNKMAKSIPAGSSSSTLESHAEDPAEASLERFAELLATHKADQQRLGLEGLCKMTDTSKVSQADAERVAQAILLGHGQDLTIRDTIEQILTETIAEGESGFNDSPSDALRLFALRALCNALETHMKRDHTAPSLDLSNDFWCTAIDSFVRTISAASILPEEASLSAKSIRLLKMIDSSITTIAAPAEELEGLLLAAYQYGQSNHASLEQESGQLMGRVIRC